MAEGDASIYNHAKEIILLGDVNFSADAFRIILLTSAYTLTIDGNVGYAGVSANEIVATGYTATGIALASLAVAQDDSNDWANWDAADVTWSSLATASPRHAVVYDDTITAPVADPLIMHFEILTDSNGGNYQLAFNTGGLIQLA